MPQQITGTIIDATGQPWKSREVVIKSLSTPILFGSSVTGTSKIVFVTKADGTIPLISGLKVGQSISFPGAMTLI
jgi:hypothetical protein